MEKYKSSCGKGIQSGKLRCGEKDKKGRIIYCSTCRELYKQRNIFVEFLKQLSFVSEMNNRGTEMLMEELKLLEVRNSSQP